MEIISTNALSKFFGSTPAANSISLNVQSGEIYGFLGLNGAGKTTLIRMLLGMIKPDNGNIILFQKELNSQFDNWNDIGYLVETPYAYPNLSVRENLQVYYKLRGLTNPEYINEIIHKLKLGRFENTKARVLSLGNQQRLGLAKALMHKPKLIILDEPINGLDPEGIVEVRALLQELADSGSAIFLSSHILGEISKIADRIGIIHEGKLLKELNADALQDQLIKKIIVITANNQEAVKLLVASNYSAVLTAENVIEISGKEAIHNSEMISTFLVEKKLPPKQLYLFTEDLEMYFLRTIRKEA